MAEGTSRARQPLEGTEALGRRVLGCCVLEPLYPIRCVSSEAWAYHNEGVLRDADDSGDAVDCKEDIAELNTDQNHEHGRRAL